MSCTVLIRLYTMRTLAVLVCCSVGRAKNSLMHSCTRLSIRTLNASRSTYRRTNRFCTRSFRASSSEVVPLSWADSPLSSFSGGFSATGSGVGVGSTGVTGCGVGVGSTGVTGSGVGVGSTGVTGCGVGCCSTGVTGCGVGCCSTGVTGCGVGVGSTGVTGSGVGVCSTGVADCAAFSVSCFAFSSASSFVAASSSVMSRPATASLISCVTSISGIW